MVVRVSSIGPDRTVVFYDKQVEEAINKYNIGGLCLFQGGPVKQATILNHLQAIAQTPLLVTIDAEWCGHAYGQCNWATPANDDGGRAGPVAHIRIWPGGR